MSPFKSPWRMSSYSVEDLGSYGQRVIWDIWSAPYVPCSSKLMKVEIRTASAAISQQYRGSFTNAVILGSQPVNGIIWETNSPVVKFTKLNVPCSVGEAGTLLSFNIVGT